MSDPETTPEIPKLLYKYRAPDIDKLRHILIDDELWASNPTDFNDPFDCFPFIDKRGTYDEAKNWIGVRQGRGAAPVGRNKRRAFAQRIAKDGVAAISEKSPAELWKESIAGFGVVSFAESCQNILMWSHYAHNHSGVCLEFATAHVPFKGAGKVVYDVNRPVFRPLDIDRTNLMERILLRKADFWEYEQEWRCIQIKEGPGKMPFPAAALTTVILGAAAKHDFVEKLESLITQRKTPVPIKRVEFDPEFFKVHLRHG
ncbi:DUF2971 domain-containing protein [Sphingomonas sp. Root720]|uniref:DUF2971 domain-containing protein n=1 Tax=Sphingomonas sp. Root720 TaxID=1736595 RepID=UPI0006F473D4|nr:DUF2971 domain-containing protein [Sphingomonas sp. Root720]KRB93668.1 hypothetical protein ASE22_24995 [Sphingomonas sp. Root720]